MLSMLSLILAQRDLRERHRTVQREIILNNKVIRLSHGTLILCKNKEDIGMFWYIFPSSLNVDPWVVVEDGKKIGADGKRELLNFVGGKYSSLF